MKNLKKSLIFTLIFGLLAGNSLGAMDQYDTFDRDYDEFVELCDQEFNKKNPYDQTQCCICLNTLDLISHENTITLPCYHKYDTLCLLEYVLADTSPITCPICRKPYILKHILGDKEITHFLTQEQIKILNNKIYRHTSQEKWLAHKYFTQLAQSMVDKHRDTAKNIKKAMRKIAQQNLKNYEQQNILKRYTDLLLKSPSFLCYKDAVALEQKIANRELGRLWSSFWSGYVDMHTALYLTRLMVGFAQYHAQLPSSITTAYSSEKIAIFLGSPLLNYTVDLGDLLKIAPINFYPHKALGVLFFAENFLHMFIACGALLTLPEIIADKLPYWPKEERAYKESAILGTEDHENLQRNPHYRFTTPTWWIGHVGLPLLYQYVLANNVIHRETLEQLYKNRINA